MIHLSVHPATLLWWEQRETCRRCAHHTRDTKTRGATRPRSPNEPTGERCRAAYAPVGEWRDYMYCIDARMDSGPCGPEAKLFEEREAE